MCNGKKVSKSYFNITNMKVTSKYMQNYSKKLFISVNPIKPQWNTTRYPLEWIKYKGWQYQVLARMRFDLNSHSLLV